MRILSIPPNGKIRDHLVANPIDNVTEKLERYQEKIPRRKHNILQKIKSYGVVYFHVPQFVDEDIRNLVGKERRERERDSTYYAFPLHFIRDLSESKLRITYLVLVNRVPLTSLCNYYFAIYIACT